MSWLGSAMHEEAKAAMREAGGRQPGYAAVWDIIDQAPAHWTAFDFAVVWRAVEAFGDAMGIESER